MDHIDLGADSLQRKSNVRSLMAAGKIRFGGNKKLKIYGTLSCPSGKRMKVQNRIFFETEEKAVIAGYRPCGNCMPTKYKQWKEKNALP